MFKIIAIVLLSISTLALLGSTIGLAATFNSHCKAPKHNTTEVPLCNEVPGYVNSFLDLEDLVDAYISLSEKEDKALLSSMMVEGTSFENGKKNYADQANILSGSVVALKQLGVSCNQPGDTPVEITDRYKLAHGYSNMTYIEFLASQGIMA